MSGADKSSPDTSPTLFDMATYESAARTTSPPLTSSAEGRPASLFPTPGKDEERQMTATSGLRCYASWEKLGHGSCWQRTLLRSFTTTRALYSPTMRLRWKLSATKSRPRLYFQLAPSERPTDETGCSLLPTLTARGGPNKNANAKKWGEAKSLQEMARRSLWPTLTVSGNWNRKGASPNSGDGLATAIGGRLSPLWLEWFMGLPPRWTERDARPASATPSSPSARSTSGEPS